jgi:hypothetical protein
MAGVLAFIPTEYQPGIIATKYYIGILLFQNAWTLLIPDYHT